jgi:hypothetical protein
MAPVDPVEMIGHMSIEYTHYFLVKDLSWCPTKAHGEAAHQVLTSWRLVTGKPDLQEVCRRPGGRSSRRRVEARTIRSSGRLPDELVMAYPNVEGPPVEAVMGAAQYCGRGDVFSPSLWSVKLVLGRDFKVLSATDFGMVSTELEDDEEAYDWDDGTLAIPFDAAAEELPRTSVVARHPLDGRPISAPDGFTGLWRSALILACGKAHPLFVQGDHPFQGVPERRFVRDLEAALGTTVLEAGAFA